MARATTDVDRGGDRLGETARPYARRTIELVSQVAHGLEALDGDHDAAEQQQRLADAGVGNRWNLKRSVEGRTDVVGEVGESQHRGEHQHGDERGALEHREPAEAARDAHHHDEDDHRRSQASLRDIGPRFVEVADHVLGHDPQIQRYRDHICDDDHHVREPFHALCERIELAAFGERLYV